MRKRRFKSATRVVKTSGLTTNTKAKGSFAALCLPSQRAMICAAFVFSPKFYIR
jgi:hypothetical protein